MKTILKKVWAYILAGLLILSAVLGVWFLWKNFLSKFFLSSSPSHNGVDMSVTNPNEQQDNKDSDSLSAALKGILGI